MKWPYTLALTVLCAAMPLHAADQPPADDAANAATGQRDGERLRAYRQFLQDLKDKEPETFKQLRKLEEKEPEAYRRRVYLLMRERGYAPNLSVVDESSEAAIRDWPPAGQKPAKTGDAADARTGAGSGTDGTATKPPEATTLPKGRPGPGTNTTTSAAPTGAPPRNGGDGSPGDRRPERGPEHNPGEMKTILASLRQEDPDRFAELIKKREADPPSFRRELHDWVGRRVDAHREHNFADDEARATELARKYQRATTDGEKSSLKEQMRAALNQNFDQRMQEQQDRVEEMAQALADLKERLEARAAKKADIVDARLEQLLLPPDQRLDAPPKGIGPAGPNTPNSPK